MGTSYDILFHLGVGVTGHRSQVWNGTESKGTQAKHFFNLVFSMVTRASGGVVHYKK